MAIFKQTKIDQIIISENDIVCYREATTIFENEEVLSVNFHRVSLTPGQDLTEAPDKIALICNVLWTDEVINAYKDSTKDD